MANIGNHTPQFYQGPLQGEVEKEDEAGPAGSFQPSEPPPAELPAEEIRTVADPVRIQRQDALIERRIPGNNLPWQRLVPGFDLGRVAPNRGCTVLVKNKRVYHASYDDKQIVIKYEDEKQTTAARLALSSSILRNLRASAPRVEVVRDGQQIAELQRATGDRKGGSVAVMSFVRGRDLADIAASEDPAQIRTLSQTSCFREIGRITMIDYLLHAKPDRLQKDAWNPNNLMVKPQRLMIGGLRVVAIDNSTDLMSQRRNANTGELEPWVSRAELMEFRNNAFIGEFFESFMRYGLFISAPADSLRSAFIQGAKMGVYEIVDRFTSVEQNARVLDLQKIRQFLIQSGCDERNLDATVANMAARVTVFIELSGAEHLRMGTIEYYRTRGFDSQHRIFS